MRTSSGVTFKSSVYEILVPYQKKRAVLSHSDDTSGQALDSFGQFDEEEKINDTLR